MIPVLILPIGALINAITLLCLTWLSIPFSILSILSGNTLLSAIFIISFKPYLKTKSIIFTPQYKLGTTSKIALVIIVSAFIFGLVHTLLPTVHYDSLTNWNIRSKVSYFRAELVFDTQDGLIEKPYYPVLHHALQITAMQFVPGWHDAVANGITFLLCLNLFVLVYALLREQGFGTSLITMAAFFSLPLLTMHTGQGYADLPLLLYSSASLLFFLRYCADHCASHLFLSGIMAAACVWTKAEGLFFCLVPWLLMVLVQIRSIRREMLFATVLSLLWPIFILVHGYSLTPHGSSDTGVMLNTTAFLTLLSALFVQGSFGIFWYVAVTLLLWVVINRQWSPALTWALLSFVGYCGVYLFTSNAEYLILGQSFDRQMLLPATLLIIGFSSIISRNNTVVLR